MAVVILQRCRADSPRVIFVDTGFERWNEQFARSSPQPRARAVELVPDAFVVHLEDGRQLTVPLEWFPRLWDATPEQRDHYELIGQALAIHWPDVDEDISVSRLFGLPC